jgi:hypothetical protein
VRSKSPLRCRDRIRREPTHRDDQTSLQDRQLFLQVRTTREDLDLLWTPIAYPAIHGLGRTALHDVCDEDFIPGQLHVREEIVEDRSRLSHERLASPVLLRAGRLPDQE